MHSAHLASFVVAACWIAWVGYWVITWRWQKPLTQRQSGSERAGYTILLMVSFILVLADWHAIPVLGTRLIAASTLGAWLGAAFSVLGVALTIWARVVLADDWSSDVVFKQGQNLITTGPYALVRHPIYTGLILMFVGTALVEGTIAAILAIVLAFWSFVIKFIQEETLMLEHFGPQYRAYQSRTKKIIPYLF